MDSGRLSAGVKTAAFPAFRPDIGKRQPRWHAFGAVSRISRLELAHPFRQFQGEPSVGAQASRYWIASCRGTSSLPIKIAFPKMHRTSAKTTPAEASIPQSRSRRSCSCPATSYPSRVTPQPARPHELGGPGALVRHRGASVPARLFRISPIWYCRGPCDEAQILPDTCPFGIAVVGQFDSAVPWPSSAATASRLTPSRPVPAMPMCRPRRRLKPRDPFPSASSLCAEAVPRSRPPVWRRTFAVAHAYCWPADHDRIAVRREFHQRTPVDRRLAFDFARPSRNCRTLPVCQMMSMS